MPNPVAWLQVDNHAVFRARPRARSILLLALCLAPSLSEAQSAPRPEQLIKWRQSAYQVIAWNSARIKAALAPGQYNQAEVRAATRALNAVAAAGLPGLFAPGTEQGKGWRETTARAAVFSDAAKFRELNDDFAREAGVLARVGAGTDQKAVQDQFLRVAQSCKSCHEKFRQTD
jgi:cytochrome c556